MKTAIFINTFAKMNNYNLEELTQYDIRMIAIVPDDEHKKFSQAYGKYFSEIYSCASQSNNYFEKISYDFAKNITEKEMAQHDVRIISLSEDNLLLTAKLRDELNIPGMRLEQAMTFRDKTIMKDLLKKKGIRTPHYVKFDPNSAKAPVSYFNFLKQEIGLPFIMKPFNLLGSLGVAIIDSFDQFNEFCKTNEIQPCYEYEAEEFISGTLYHCDSIIQNNKIIFDVCCEYTNPNFDFQLGKSVISMQLRNTDPVTQRLSSFNEEVLKAMNLEQGISHHELFINRKNEIIFLEIAARSPGAIITPMYRNSMNVPMEDIDFKMQMDISFKLKPIYDMYYLSGILPTITGTVKELVSPTIKSKHDIKWMVKEGDVINASSSLRDKSASIMAWNNNYDELLNDFNFLRDYQSISVN